MKLTCHEHTATKSFRLNAFKTYLTFGKFFSATNPSGKSYEYYCCQRLVIRYRGASTSRRIVCSVYWITDRDVASRPIEWRFYPANPSNKLHLTSLRYVFRSDLEVSYAKGLQKLATKLLKASRDGLGSVNQAWQRVGTEMEHQADIHKLVNVNHFGHIDLHVAGYMNARILLMQSKFRHGR